MQMPLMLGGQPQSVNASLSGTLTSALERFSVRTFCREAH